MANSPLVAFVAKCTQGVQCPMELSTYFRINASETGQVPIWYESVRGCFIAMSTFS